MIHGPAHVALVRRAGRRDDRPASPRRGSAGRARSAVTASRSINEGHEAGASLPHSHSQLAWLPAPAPLVVAERGLPAVIEVVRARRRYCRLPGRKPRPLRGRDRAVPSASRTGSRATCSRRRSACSRSSSGGFNASAARSSCRSTRGSTTVHTGTSSSFPRTTRCSPGSSSGRASTSTTLAPEDAAVRLAPPRRTRSSARGSGGRRRSPRRGSGPCPSPA